MNSAASDFLKNNLKWDLSGLSYLSKVGGLSSENYKLVFKNQHYFLRLCPYTYLHTDRALELKIINKAASMGLCKKPLYYSIKSGDMLSPWINGAMPSENEFASFEFIDMVTENLRTLHGLTCHVDFQPYEHIEKRIELCRESNIPLPSSLDMILDKLNSLKIKLRKNQLIGLCHNDLNASNMILSKDKLYFVDYEYSCMGDVFFDLATVAWFLNKECRQHLLKSYFGHYKEEYYEKLMDYLYIVKLYNATWSLLKSKDWKGEYDYFKGANIIFDELLNYESIRS